MSGSHRVAAAASHLWVSPLPLPSSSTPSSPTKLFLFPSSNSRSQHSTPPSLLGEFAYPPTDSQENVSPSPLPLSCDTCFSPSPAFHGSLTLLGPSADSYLPLNCSQLPATPLYRAPGQAKALVPWQIVECHFRVPSY